MAADSQERAVVYRRVSTTDQVDGTSLDTQLEVCMAEVAQRGLVLADRWDYTDGGLSGKNLDRPALTEMRDDARRARFEVVVVAKADRLSRNHLDSLNLLRYFETLGVSVITPDGDLIGRTPEQRLQRNILGVIAEFEREQILRRTKAGLRATAAKGAWPGGPAPFGFRLAKSTDRSVGTRLEIDPSEATTIHRAVAIILDEGGSTLRAATELNALGLKPRRANRWTHGFLRRQLLDAPLSGEWEYGRTRGRAVPSGDPVKVPIPALMSPERHAALRDALAQTSTGRQATKRKRNYLLSGGRLTGPCGGSYHGIFRSDRRTAAYRCGNRMAEAEHPCSCRNLPADAVEEHIWSAIVSSLSSPEALMSFASEYWTHRSVQVQAERDELSKVRAQRKRLEETVRHRVAEYMAEGVPAALLLDAAEAMQAEIESLREREVVLDGEVAEEADRSARTRTLWSLAETAAERLPQMDADQRKAVVALLDIRVTVLDWEVCGHCLGKGKVRGGTGGLPCPVCRNVRHVPNMVIKGKLTESLFSPGISLENVGDFPNTTVRRSTCSPPWARDTTGRCRRCTPTTPPMRCDGCRPSC
jgi:DNA invertase Pin-like site-specific DNA recombinase